VGKLTVISAPAGFGKTTLIGQWIADHATVGWVSLDEKDNDPARFWRYVFAALSDAHPGLSVPLPEALQSRHPAQINGVLVKLINRIADRSGRLLLVLDDYHVIEADTIHETLTFLIDHMPAQMHLVIASRVDPPLPLSRLRGRRQLTELRAADLRFTVHEATRFLNQMMGLALPAEDVMALDSRTEGWIVGLQLAALSLRGQDPERVAGFIAGFTGSHRYVLDYLVEEVLQRQTEAVQSFLLQTAILDRLSGALCDAVTGLSSGQSTLEELERANLFLVPLDDERRWYRYHRLFADLLRSRLEQLDSVTVTALHRRAAAWYESRGLVLEAMGHALDCGDVEWAARLVEGNALAMVDHGELTALMEWLDGLSSSAARSRPWLDIAHAWALAYAGRVDAVGRLLEDVEVTLVRFPQGDDRRRILGHGEAIRAYVAWMKGEAPSAIDHARRALGHLPPTDRTARAQVATTLGTALVQRYQLDAAAEALEQAVAVGRTTENLHVELLATSGLAHLLIIQGQLHRAAAICRKALGRAEAQIKRDGLPAPAAGNTYALFSDVMREWNDLENAVALARQGLELTERWGQADTLTVNAIYLAEALRALGDLEGALDAIRRAKQITRDISPWMRIQVTMVEALLLLDQGNVEAAVRWAEAHALGHEDAFDPAAGIAYAVLARVRIAQGLSDQALGILARLRGQAQAAGATGRLISVLSIEAVALQALGRVEEALITLTRALSLAEPEGYVRVFLDLGRPMERLLRQVTGPAIVGYGPALLEAFEAERRPSPAPAPAPASPLIEPLTDREMEVLGVLSGGLSNQEIAVQLHIAVGTVKNHLKSIYGKLDVHSRIQAVARARELGLLRK
jgi:LuxR family maltose regulon positive regulatory protein